MSHRSPIRRYYVPNSVVFITQALDNRAPVLLETRTLALLRQTLHNTKELYPFTMLAYVYLPDHLHLLIRPHEGITHSKILHSFKSYFAHVYAGEIAGEASVRFWQKRYYDHIIRSESDLEDHLDYIHYNPCKHGYVSRPEDWQHTSYQHWRERGAYDTGWGWELPDTLHRMNPAAGTFGE